MHQTAYNRSNLLKYDNYYGGGVVKTQCNPGDLFTGIHDNITTADQPKEKSHYLIFKLDLKTQAVIF